MSDGLDAPMFEGERRRTLALEMFELAFNSFESFHDGVVGADLAYLMGAILDMSDDSFVDWTDAAIDDSHLLPAHMFLACPPDHPVWQFVVR